MYGLSVPKHMLERLFARSGAESQQDQRGQWSNQQPAVDGPLQSGVGGHGRSSGSQYAGEKQPGQWLRDRTVRPNAVEHTFPSGDQQ